MSIKLSRAPLYEQAYDAILRMMLDGELNSGQRVTESSLAASLGVSPTPVREAMRKLEHDGLLQSSGNAVRIIELQPDDIEHLYVCREALEVVALESAIDELTDADFEHLTTLLDAATDAAQRQNSLELVRINTEFHDYLIEAAGNPWLLAAIGFVRRPLLLARIHITHDEGEVDRILNDHQAIVDTLQQGDITSATAHIRQHMRADCKYMCRALDR